MRVLHIAETIQGGPATYFNEILPSQVDSLGSSNVRMIVPRQHVRFLNNVPSSSVATFNRPGRVPGLAGLAKAVIHETHAFRPDIIHAHSTFAGGIVRALSALTGGFPPVVYCPHGWVFDMETLGPLRRPAKLIERMLSPWCDRVIAISRYEYNQGLKIGIRPDHMTIIENGISIEKPQAVPARWNDSRLKVLFIGRLDRQKGVDVLLKAAASLGSQATIRIVGATVNNRADFMKSLPDNVEFIGWQSAAEIAGHLDVCDVVAMPSRWEGFGLVAVEAMRSAKPVIASAVGGLQSVVSDGETGVLVPPENPQALAAAIVSRNPDEWARLGLAGRERFIKRYTSERTTGELMQLYQGVLDARRLRNPQPA